MLFIAVEEEEVEIEFYALQGLAVPRAKRYEIRIDDYKFKVEAPELKGHQLLSLVGLCPCSHALLQIMHHADAEPIGPDECVNLHRVGVERFATVHKEDVTIFVDGKPIHLHRGPVAVSEIKRLADIPDAYLLHQDVAAKLETLADTEQVIIDGCEVFVARPGRGGSS